MKSDCDTPRKTLSTTRMHLLEPILSPLHNFVADNEHTFSWTHREQQVRENYFEGRWTGEQKEQHERSCLVTSPAIRRGSQKNDVVRRWGRQKVMMLKWRTAVSFQFEGPCVTKRQGNVNEECKAWMSYELTDNCQTLLKLLTSPL